MSWYFKNIIYLVEMYLMVLNDLFCFFLEDRFLIIFFSQGFIFVVYFQLFSFFEVLFEQVGGAIFESDVVSSFEGIVYVIFFVICQEEKCLRFFYSFQNFKILYLQCFFRQSFFYVVFLVVLSIWKYFSNRMLFFFMCFLGILFF